MRSPVDRALVLNTQFSSHRRGFVNGKTPAVERPRFLRAREATLLAVPVVEVREGRAAIRTLHASPHFLVSSA